MKRLDFNKPSNTIMNSILSGTIHPIENRYLTISELKRLSSFPDDFKLIGKFQDQWARIGNSVMPKFMEAIAIHIKKEVLEKMELEIKESADIIS